MRHVLFPAMRQHLRPPTRLAIDGKALLRGVPFSAQPDCLLAVYRLESAQVELKGGVLNS